MTSQLLSTPAAISTPGRFGKAVLPAIDAAVLAIGSLAAWWRADTDFLQANGQTTWFDRVNGRRLTPDNGIGPTGAAGVVAGLPAVAMGGAAARLADPDGLNFLPTGADYTIAAMVLPNPGFAANWSVYGNDGSASTYDDLSITTARKIQVHRAGASLALSSTVHAAGSWVWFADSFVNAGTSRKVVANGVQEIAVSAPNPVANNTLVVGATEAAPGVGYDVAPCYLSDLLVFTAPLAETAHAADLAALSAYFAGRYGAVFG